MPLVNFRDIGGIKLPNGKSVKKHALFRTGALSFLDMNEAEDLLREKGASCYIDFCSDFEIQKRDKNYFYHKIKNLYKLQFDMHDDQFSSIYLPNSSEWADFYMRIFEKNLSQVIIFLEILSETTNNPIIYGCSAGKDRSGIMTAILLSLLEVPQDEIIKDYYLSNQGLADHYHLFDDYKKELGRTREEFINHFLIVSNDNMKLFLRNISVHYGNVNTCLLNAGINEAVINKIKFKFIE